MFTVSSFCEANCSFIQSSKSHVYLFEADGTVVAFLFGKQTKVLDHVLRTGMDTRSPVDVVTILRFEAGCLLLFLVTEGGR
jgi:hypothetical protein